MSTSKRSAGKASAIPKTESGIDEASVARISKRIWVIFAILVGLQIYTGTAMITARGQLESTTAALHQAEIRAKQTGLKLGGALVDKEQAQADKKALLKEISEQGQLIEKLSLKEEKTKAALAAISTGAETADKKIAARDREISDLKQRLARARKARGKAEVRVSRIKAEVSALKAELDFVRARQEKTIAELERLRAAAEPYRASTDQAVQQAR